MKRLKLTSIGPEMERLKAYLEEILVLQGEFL